jgi:hypothetical protein
MDYTARVKNFKTTELMDGLDEELVETSHEDLVRFRFAKIQEIIWQVVRPKFEEVAAALKESEYPAVIAESKGGPDGESPIYVVSISLTMEGPPKGTLCYEWEGYRFRFTSYKGADLEESHVALDGLDEQVVRGHCDTFMERMFPAR